MKANKQYGRGDRSGRGTEPPKLCTTNPYSVAIANLSPEDFARVQALLLEYSETDIEYGGSKGKTNAACKDARFYNPNTGKKQFFNGKAPRALYSKTYYKAGFTSKPSPPLPVRGQRSKVGFWRPSGSDAGGA